MKLRVYFPGYGGGPRILEATGSSRPNESRAPCDCDWEMRETASNSVEWVPGWYVASRTRGDSAL